MSRGDWTNRELDFFKSCMDAGKTPAETSRLMNRSYTSVYSRSVAYKSTFILNRNGSGVKKSTVADRECLACHKFFKSDNCGVRRCPPCKSNSSVHVGSHVNMTVFC